MGGKRARNDGGASAVEFGLVAIPFLVLVIGMIQYGWYFYVSQTTGGAASNVVRRLQVGDCWAGTQARDLAQKQAPAVLTVVRTHNGVTVTSLPVTAASGDLITVTLTSDAELINLLPLPDGGDVIKVVEARLEDTTSSGSCS
jgi:Flp pilus assembly protein TadG